MQKLDSNAEGSALVWTVLSLAILSIVGAEVTRTVSIKYQNVLQTTQWQEALLGAESGVDLAIVELRKALYPSSLYPTYTAFATPSSSPNPGLWDGFPTTTGTTGGKETIVLNNAALAGTAMTVSVQVDAPSTICDTQNSWSFPNSGNPLSAGQYYRIRSTGTVPLPGPPRATDNKQDAILRKLSLLRERFTGATLQSRAFTAGEVAHASRRVEAIVKPASSSDLAILSVGKLDLTDQNIVIDSYDSRDPLKSTNGMYDLAKRQQNGNIATDGTIIAAGNAHVYGSASTNSGTITGFANITGTQRTDFYQDIIPVAAPTGFPATTTAITTTTTLTATGTQASPTRYTLSSLKLNGNDTLTIAGNAGTYIEIYVTGDIAISGTGTDGIVLNAGVKAKIYFGGDVAIAGNGVVNTSNQPGNFQMYGIQPAANAKTPSVSIGGNSRIDASIYAPNADVTINGGGKNTNQMFSGSVVGNTVKMNGVTNLHYDEALSAGGLVNNYKIVSWFEDNR